MASRPSRSLKHEYELYLEREIENYKESVPRSVLLSIGDDAVRALADQQQFALTELLLVDEVDKIIFKRLRLPAYATWRKRRIKLMEELRRPEHWGLSPDHMVVRAAQGVNSHSRVLLAGAEVETPALYLAAHGCDVTALAEPDAVQRVLDAAEQAGLGERVHAATLALESWTPDAPLSAVIYSPAAFSGLSAAERARVIQVLQSATADGGLHLVQTIAAGKRAPVSLDELRRRYRGWDVIVEESAPNTFMARKALA
jgi:Tellurite resistance protein TehB